MPNRSRKNSPGNRGDLGRPAASTAGGLGRIIRGDLCPLPANGKPFPLANRKLLARFEVRKFGQKEAGTKRFHFRKALSPAESRMSRKHATCFRTADESSRPGGAASAGGCFRRPPFRDRLFRRLFDFHRNHRGEFSLLILVQLVFGKEPEGDRRLKLSVIRLFDVLDAVPQI